MWVMWHWYAPCPVVLPRPVSRSAQVLARARHPSFTPEQAAGLVDGLSGHQLRELWAETSRLLEASACEEQHRFAYTVLREELLRALEGDDQRGFDRWYSRTCRVPKGPRQAIPRQGR